MFKLNIKNVIRIIPIEEDLRDELLRDFDGYDEKKQFVVTKVCWDVFDELEDALEQHARTQIMQEVAAGKRKIEKDYKTEIRIAVDKELEERMSGKRSDEKKIENVRKQIEELLQRE